MPGILPGIRPELDNNPRHLPRRAPDCIFPALFIGVRLFRRAGKDKLAVAGKMTGVKGLAVQDLKLNLVQMDGVGDKTGVDQIPDLHLPPAGFFRHRIMPPFPVQQEKQASKLIPDRGQAQIPPDLGRSRVQPWHPGQLARESSGPPP